MLDLLMDHHDRRAAIRSYILCVDEANDPLFCLKREIVEKVKSNLNNLHEN